jgi:ABC-type nitrate/sulfonate/bicarbonate transport system substrate-binding protein
MSSTAVATIILGIITVFLSVLLGRKSGQKEATEEKLEATMAQLDASKKETKLAKENAVKAQETASEAKSQLSKAKVLAQQTAVETSILDSVKTTIIEYLKTGAQRDSEMKDLANKLENARERNDIESAIEVAQQQAELAIQKGMSQYSDNSQNDK